jgi:flagellar biosynthesis protein FlhG
MLDQANDLRKLVRHSAAAPRGRRRPGLLVVAGGKGGVGTTTAAILLAAALGRRRLRTLLVDAARGGDAAVLCGLQPRRNLADVLSGRATLVETIQSGPGDLRILPGAWAGDAPVDPGPHRADRLLAQLASFTPTTDVVVLDAGNHPGRLAQRCWQAADGRLLVTTAETAAIVETYAAIKRLSGTVPILVAEGHKNGTVPFIPPAETTHVLVNMVSDRDTAEAAYRRLAVACRRLLAIQLNLLGHVKKTQKGLNLNAVPADNRGELAVFDVLLNYADYVKFNGHRGTHLWHELTPASLAPWHS